MKTIDEMLEEHDHYSLTDRLSIARRPGQRWFCYIDGIELHFAADPSNANKPFDTALAARTYLMTYSGVQAIEAAREKLNREAGIR